MKKLIIFASSFSFILLLTACTATHPTTSSEPPLNQTIIYVDHPVSLTSMLLNVPGVRVEEAGMNTKVYLRGRRPLFVVDGVQIGYNFADVLSMVDVNSVAAIEVLKDPSETFMYGRMGANGVIVFHTGTYEPDN
ncbi:MAG: TonB-dependent receptor plug domain-containing protein [Saprospiraceae bacterium]